MDKIKLEESISLCNATTGKSRKEIEKELREDLWPSSNETSQKQNLYKMKKHSKSLSIGQIKIIKRITGVPYEFLLNE